MINDVIFNLITSPFWAAYVLKYYITAYPQKGIDMERLFIASSLLLYDDTVTSLHDRRTYSNDLDQLIRKAEFNCYSIKKRLDETKDCTRKAIIILYNEQFIEIKEGLIYTKKQVKLKDIKDADIKKICKSAENLAFLFSDLRTVEICRKLRIVV